MPGTSLFGLRSRQRPLVLPDCSWAHSKWRSLTFCAPSPGPWRTTRTPANVERARKALLKSRKRSTFQHAARTIFDHTFTWNIHENLKFHSNKFEFFLYFSDENHFHLSGCVNRQTMLYYFFLQKLNFYFRQNSRGCFFSMVL